MRPIDLDLIRLFIHVLAATIWVGGQFALAGLVPTLKTLGDDAPKKVANAFARVAWPAFGVLLATGIWNVAEADMANQPTSFHMRVLAKLIAVGVTGGGALAHSYGKSKAAFAIGGAAAGLGAIAAVFLGVWLNAG